MYILFCDNRNTLDCIVICEHGSWFFFQIQIPVCVNQYEGIERNNVSYIFSTTELNTLVIVSDWKLSIVSGWNLSTLSLSLLFSWNVHISTYSQGTLGLFELKFVTKNSLEKRIQIYSRVISSLRGKIIV